MAELIFTRMVKERGLASSFRITSFGTSDCEEGNPVYAPAKKTLIMHGVPGNHIAKQISLKDVINNDYRKLRAFSVTANYFLPAFFSSVTRLSLPVKKSAMVPGPTCEPVHRS